MMIAINLSKQQALGVNPNVIPQISFTGNLGAEETMFFIIEEAKKNYFRFFATTHESIVV